MSPTRRNKFKWSPTGRTESERLFLGGDQAALALKTTGTLPSPRATQRTQQTNPPMWSHNMGARKSTQVLAFLTGCRNTFFVKLLPGTAFSASVLLVSYNMLNLPPGGSHTEKGVFPPHPWKVLGATTESSVHTSHTISKTNKDSFCKSFLSVIR